MHLDVHRRSSLCRMYLFIQYFYQRLESPKENKL